MWDLLNDEKLDPVPSEPRRRELKEGLKMIRRHERRVCAEIVHAVFVPPLCCMRPSDRSPGTILAEMLSSITGPKDHGWGLIWRFRFPGGRLGKVRCAFTDDLRYVPTIREESMERWEVFVENVGCGSPSGLSPS